MNERIGVFGGTFNPIHLGHLHIAGEIRRIFSLARVHFVVATTPPHKSPDDVIAFSHRYAMVSLATASTASFIPSMVELEPPASPFSIDTMEKLARRIGRGKQRLFFIAGGDSLSEVGTWRESERLLTSYNFIFALRPGTGTVPLEEVLAPKAFARVCDLTQSGASRMRRQFLESGGTNRIYIVNVGAPDIAATRIRKLASSGKSIQRMVPGPVNDYIRKLRLYGGR